MKRPLWACLSALFTLAGCHVAPPLQAPAPAGDSVPAVPEPAPPVTETPPPEDAASTAQVQVPPCLPADSKPKPAAKRRPKTVAKLPEAPVVEPPPVPVPVAPGEAAVKPIENTSLSILGKKVRSSDGEDLGRVVDILADAQGRVRIAIIEFGGFLGVGNRRIAVDWALLKFHPGDPDDASVILNASRRKLQGTPEYKDAGHPLALMAPAAAADGKK